MKIQQHNQDHQQDKQFMHIVNLSHHIGHQVQLIVTMYVLKYFIFQIVTNFFKFQLILFVFTFMLSLMVLLL